MISSNVLHCRYFVVDIQMVDLLYLCVLLNVNAIASYNFTQVCSYLLYFYIFYIFTSGGIPFPVCFVYNRLILYKLQAFCNFVIKNESFSSYFRDRVKIYNYQLANFNDV